MKLGLDITYDKSFKFNYIRAENIKIRKFITKSKHEIYDINFIA